MSYHPYDPRMGHDPSRKLTDGDVQDLKPEGWWGNDGQLSRDFEFGNYLEGVEFARRVALLAEEAGHHPELLVRYRRVRVRYFTYDAGGVTLADIAGARAVNQLWEELRGGGEAQA
ncbi:MULTISPECIES: 4a-hydroxytetrahydrobiopterin dehydratase [Deinococcus]|uniref:4a-hydroxytetrahydrobiopterin dehydratase n=1 Tax=Deinococcus TaxID=1298 RepID=UPI0004D44BD3|nr:MULTISPECIES: 4a-hydroxytetrahydrobiopterin dehydratase [Deinococcus]KEF35240.1 pterin dehydratase [Deinococcus sp. RL]